MADAKKSILKAAVKEFATEGFGGARMDRIAKKAKVNKAMIFYYFGSKENLYKEIVRNLITELFTPMSQILATAQTAEEFMEKVPQMQIGIFAKNSNFIRIMAQDLVRDPEHINTIFKEFFGENYDRGPGRLKQHIQRWYDEGAISEPDPMHFMLNMMSLTVYTFIGLPILESVLNEDVDQKGDFYEKRIASVINLLKRGMLK